MSGFDRQMSAYQVDWRRQYARSQIAGQQNGQRRDWILPRDLWEQGLWHNIRSDGDWSLPAYLAENRIQKHQGVHNLKSSWVLCANLYFPFGQSESGRDLLAGFLDKHVNDSITSVERLELEYCETGELHPSELLGEQGGSRGAGQTSPDIAFIVNQGRGLILTENKFVEHSFYSCSARTHKGNSARAGNPDPTRCEDALAVVDDPASQCHQVAWGRKYWDHLAPVVRRNAVATLRTCPAGFAGYQLLRQQALAEGIARSRKYELVVSCLAIDERNKTLQNSLKSTGLSDVGEWNNLFTGRAEFSIFTHQQWFAWVGKHSRDSRWDNWLGYVESRYGF